MCYAARSSRRCQRPWAWKVSQWSRSVSNWTSSMPVATTDGLRTRYQVSGSGPPLLMYSPAGFDAVLEKWTTQGTYAKTRILDRLRERFTCILFDRRECGESGGRVEALTWSHYAAQGKALLDHLNIERAHIMGGCMGVCPTLTFARDYPASVN